VVSADNSRAANISMSEKKEKVSGIAWLLLIDLSRSCVASSPEEGRNPHR
jgi:hypothetical protein